MAACGARWCAFVAGWLCLAGRAAGEQKNVVLIVVDDLRPDLTYGFGQDQVRTPNIDALAKEGTVFHNAYCQQAICGPTRNSFLSGRRPQRTQVWNFADNFREVGADWVTLPQYFKEAGYTTLGSGKIYHPNSPPNFDEPYSWSQDRKYQDLGDTVTPPCNQKTTSSLCVRNNTFEHFTDYRNVKLAVENLQYAVAKQRDDGSPFFIAFGAHKPHLPFVMPQEFWNLYDDADIALPVHEEAPANMPPIAFTYEIDGMSTFHVDGVPYPTPYPSGSTAFPHNVTRALRRGYYAAVSWTDHVIGELLKEVKALGVDDDTVVALIGDHGWQLGEHNIWGKHTNFELATHVPLLVRGAKNGAAGRAQNDVYSLVESVDLYPTLAALAGLPAPADVDGADLSPMMSGAAATKPQNVAFSEYPRCPPDVTKPWGDLTSCIWTEKSAFTAIGYSVRTPAFRYTVWLHWDGEALAGDFKRPPVGTELYPHDPRPGPVDFDKFENENVAGDPTYAAVVEEMFALAKAHWAK